MIFRFLFLLSVLCLFSVVGFAQNKRLDIEISVNNPIVSVKSKKASLKIKITNLSTSDFKAENIKYVSFYLLKWGSSDFYISGKDFLKINKKLKSKTLKQNETVEFEIKLNKLKWRDKLVDSEKKYKPLKRLTLATYYLFVVIDINGEKSHASNEIAVKLISK